MCPVIGISFGSVVGVNGALQVLNPPPYGDLMSIFFELGLQNHLPPLNSRRWFIREIKWVGLFRTSEEFGSLNLVLHPSE